MAKSHGFKDYQAVVSCLLMGIIFFFTLKLPSLVLDMPKYVFGFRKKFRKNFGKIPEKFVFGFIFGFDIESFDIESFDIEGFDIESFDIESFDIETWRHFLVVVVLRPTIRHF